MAAEKMASFRSRIGTTERGEGDEPCNDKGTSDNHPGTVRTPQKVKEEVLLGVELRTMRCSWQKKHIIRAKVRKYLK